MNRIVKGKTKNVEISVQLASEEIVVCNGKDLDALFDIYDRNELLDQGREYIRPYVPAIKEQYQLLAKSDKNLLIELSLINGKTKERSTITFCKNTPGGYYSQMIINDHPQGEGTNPANTLKLLLFALPMIRNDSYQCGFQEKTNYTNNMFGFRASEKAERILGLRLCETVRYYYMRFPKKAVSEDLGTNKDERLQRVEEVSENNHATLISFLKRNRSQIFIETENLDDSDLTMKGLNEAFREVDSGRSRRVFLAYDVMGKAPVAATITYRGALRNFRGLCNQTYLIVDPDLNPEELLPVVTALMNQVVQLYQGYPLPWFPVLATNSERSILELLGAEFDLEFCNFYAKRDPRIFDYFEKLFRDRLEKLERRAKRMTNSR